MDDYLGRGARALYPDLPFCKLPMHMFSQYDSDGPLFIILKVTFEYMQRNDMRGIDALTEAGREQVIDLFQEVREALVNEDWLQQPKLYLQDDVDPEELTDLRVKAALCGFELADSPDDEGVTHIVIPDTEEVKQTDIDEEYCRTLEIKGQKALVHWWYFPDSYDEWIPVQNISGDPEEQEAPSQGPVTVYRRWVRDSCFFNEWMNPADYAPDDEAEEEEEAKPAHGAKRARDDSAAAESEARRRRMEETAALMEEPGYGLPLLGNNGTVFRAEQLTDEAVTLCAFPHVIRRTVDIPHSSVAQLATCSNGRRGDTQPLPSHMRVENLSQGQLTAPVGGVEHAPTPQAVLAALHLALSVADPKGDASKFDDFVDDLDPPGTPTRRAHEAAPPKLPSAAHSPSQ
eukprot:CAMPEP_0114314792 /NCGR_PEP_ID=MMETSP0059-20121206/22059_1 /TAXON_ID=36894 /ORGANISM="Pyramimonas parkeae, Strain CCMP726" /LENGTH=401 /DNA_ID=CAMNT_0001440081 /DNA_START=111 /DNA_END=1313 /DNA_ORIENTATION=+